MKTLIENGMVIAWRDDAQRVIAAGAVVYEDGEIVHVGESYDGDADETIDAGGRLVSPGFVNIHTHVTDSPYTRGWMEDQGEANFTAMYKILPSVRRATTPEDSYIAAEAAFVEMMLAGTTTVVEMGFDAEIMDGGDIAHTRHIADIAGRLGLRCYSAPRYRTGYWGLNAKGAVDYSHYPDDGRQRFDDCVAFCRDYDGRHDGRVKTMLAPGQVDTCDAGLLEDTRRAANELGVPIQLHAGQSPTEYRRIQDGHGKSTVMLLADTGLLGRDFIIGHGIFLAEDGNVGSCPAAEMELLRESGTSIGHLPWAKARQATPLNSFHKYRAAGINVALGTDTFPFDMVSEMRFASILCKVVEGKPGTGTSPEIFHAATVGGADALGRPDLGRLAPGCRADVLLIDVTRPHAVPMRDPFKFLVLSASGSDVDTVIIDGRRVVEGREILTTDLAAVLARLEEASRRVWRRLDL